MLGGVYEFTTLGVDMSFTALVVVGGRPTLLKYPESQLRSDCVWRSDICVSHVYVRRRHTPLDSLVRSSRLGLGISD